MKHLRSRLLVLTGLACAALVAQATTALGATFTVTSTEDTGAGSLRQAITESNAAGPGNTIAFAIPGPGPFKINLATALPSVFAAGTTIDGCTQPGANCAATPLVVAIQVAGQGFKVAANDVTIRGLSLTEAGSGGAVNPSRLAFEGKFVLPRNLTVADNYVGLAPDGSAAGNVRSFQLEAGNRNLELAGLRILDNVIGSNSSTGIDALSNPFGTARPLLNPRFEGNIIGLDPTGTEPRPNAGNGMLIDESSNGRIVGNVIVGNAGAGIVHGGQTQATPHSDPAIDPGLLIAGNVIEGNGGEGISLGVDDNGTFPGAKNPYSGPIRVFGNTIRGNGSAGSFPGIAITEAPDTQRPNIQIGGLAPGQPNLVSGNTGAGVAIGAGTADTSVAVTVRGNSIFANGGPPIDLAGDGPTANAPAGELRTGPNALLNFPTLGALEHGSLIVSGTYEGPPSAAVTLDFYKSETEAGPQAWIGSTVVTTDGAGLAPFRAEFEPDVPAGWFVAATATDAAGSTSEFGAALEVSPPPAGATETPSASAAAGGSTPSQGGAPASSGGAPASGTPSPKPAKEKQGKKKHHGQKQGKPQPTLAVEPSGLAARPSSVLTYRIVVANPGGAATRGVKVCDHLPAGQTALRTEPRAGGGARPCWRLGVLAAGARRVLRLTVQVAAAADAGTQRNRVVATAAGVAGVRAATARARVRPLPETGCGSRLPRPLPGAAPRC